MDPPARSSLRSFASTSRYTSPLRSKGLNSSSRVSQMGTYSRPRTDVPTASLPGPRYEGPPAIPSKIVTIAVRLLIIHGALTPAGQGRVQEAFARQPSAGAKAPEVGGVLRPRARRWPPSSYLSFTPFFRSIFITWLRNQVQTNSATPEVLKSCAVAMKVSVMRCARACELVACMWRYP